MVSIKLYQGVIMTGKNYFIMLEVIQAMIRQPKVLRFVQFNKTRKQFGVNF
ncbi:MAG: hypothetical protein NTY96_04620 [Bacteroidetes bacterium]|nr:hypothetical protein [Bacteroidota bacterium]